VGKRSRTVDHEDDFLGRPLDVLDQEVRRCEMMRAIAATSRNRKSLESRIHWLRRLRRRHPENGCD
jgi:hypothetical protein